MGASEKVRAWSKETFHLNDMDQPLISSHVEPQWRNNGGVKATIGGPYHDKKEYTD